MRHSEDCSEVEWNGVSCKFTKTQSAAVEVLLRNMGLAVKEKQFLRKLDTKEVDSGTSSSKGAACVLSLEKTCRRKRLRSC
jgi:hypothetical protein